MITSAKAICCLHSSLSSICCITCLASTNVIIASILYCDCISSSTKKVCATGPGSARPVVSIIIISNLSFRFIRLPSMRIRSPRTVQQIHPLFISKISSSAPITSSLSTPTSPNSFSITAIFLP